MLPAEGLSVPHPPAPWTARPAPLPPGAAVPARPSSASPLRLPVRNGSGCRPAACGPHHISTTWSSPSVLAPPAAPLELEELSGASSASDGVPCGQPVLPRPPRPRRGARGWPARAGHRTQAAGGNEPEAGGNPGKSSTGPSWASLRSGQPFSPRELVLLPVPKAAAGQPEGSGFLSLLPQGVAQGSGSWRRGSWGLRPGP